MGDYVTLAQVRTISGLTTTNISDTDLEAVITLAENQVDQEAEVSLSASQKTLAAGYLAASMAMLRKASATSGGSGGSYSFGPLRVDGKSAQQYRTIMADKFQNMYESILSNATSDDGIRRIED